MPQLLQLTPLRYFLLLTLLVAFGQRARGQQRFEAGYLIDTAGVRTEVRIFNRDWQYNPEKIQVIREQETEPATLLTENLREFGIEGKARYVNREVSIEKSSTLTSLLSDTFAVYRQERVLLRVEVEGAASLYSYRSRQVQKYFLSTGDEVPTQLVYTRTLTPGGQIAEARTFVQQLTTRLRCGNDNLVSSHLRYILTSIRRVVVQYNTCQSGENPIVYENAHTGSKPFRFTLLPGFYFTNFRFSRFDVDKVIADMPFQVVPRLGVDLELILPFAGNKLAVLLRPSYYHFSSSAADLLGTNPGSVSVSYGGLDIPLGLRYYSFLTPNLKLFVTGNLGYTFISGGEIQWSNRLPLAMQPTLSLAADVGVRYHDHWGFSLGYVKNSSSITSSRLGTTTGGLRAMLGYTL